MIVFFLLFLALFSSSVLSIGHPVVEKLRKYNESKASQNICNFGKNQSPISIEENTVNKILLPAIEFFGYHNYLTPPVTLTNDGNTVILRSGSDINDIRRPYVTGSALTSNYIFDSLHFHWGRKDNNGSEHVINSKRYAMEMHVLHRNAKFNSTEEAQNYKDGLVIFGFFFIADTKTDNIHFQEVVRHLKQVHQTNRTYTLPVSFPLSSLFPPNLDSYFVYKGSLTTPPCSESVTWFVFPDPIFISDKQMQSFRQLPIPYNVRAVQAIGKRRVLYRRFDRTVPADVLERISHRSAFDDT